MKNIFNLTLILLTLSVYGQQENYIISKYDDTTYCEFKGNFGNIKAIVDGKEVKLDPNELKSYLYRGTKYIPGPGGFAELVLEGPMTLAVTYLNGKAVFHVKLNTDESSDFMRLGGGMWRKQLKEIGKDCPNFNVEVDNYGANDYYRTTLYKLVTIYNECQLPEDEKIFSTNEKLKIYVYQTYQDYLKKEGKYIGILNGFQDGLKDGLLNTTLLYVADGERSNQKLQLKGFWGFEIDTCLFRVEPKFPVVVLKQKDLVFYFDGRSFLTALINKQASYGSNEVNGVFYSKDLNSAVEPLDQLKSGDSKHAELIECVKKGKKIKQINSDMQLEFERNNRNNRYCNCIVNY